MTSIRKFPEYPPYFPSASMGHSAGGLDLSLVSMKSLGVDFEALNTVTICGERTMIDQ